MAATETVDVDEMETTDSVENSLTDVSRTTEGSDGGTVAKKAAEFCYDGDEDDDDDDDADDEDDICRELAQLN